nr:Gp15 family bacteriophage protein [uncultured Mediterraneibacter sp.]
MNVFYEELPESLEINGREYPVITDFREWIRFSDMLKSDIPPEFKLEFLSEMFLEKVPDLYTEDEIEEVMDAITSFLSLSGTEFPDISSDEANSEEESEEVEYEEQRAKKAIYYEQDAPYIISAFRREYQIDLLSVPYMHWWEFRMLLDGLSEESQIKKRIYWRTCDVSKMDKKERREILKIRRSITIPEEEYVSDEDIGNAFT